MSGLFSIIPNRLYEPLNYLRKRFGIDRPVFYAIIARLWGVCAGPISALLIISLFTPAIQGYYYTFSNLLSLQVFVVLGLGTVIVQFASHEWSKLHLNDQGIICGDETALLRLTSLGRLAGKWFITGGGILIFGLAVGGTLFFSSADNLSSNVNWFAPWISLCVLTGIIVMLLPVWSLLEGCNQITNLYRFRFWQGIIGTCSAWVALLLGMELWTTVVSSITYLITSFYFLKKYYCGFITTFLRARPENQTVSWYKEIFPMQWRIAISWASGYFVFSFFTPVLFYYQGPVIAGQFGLTWGLINLVGTISDSWVSPKVPQFGILIAQNKYMDLNALFWEMVKRVIFVSVGAGILIWLGVFTLDHMGHRFASRLLSPFPVALLMLTQIINAISVPFSCYMRAHKEEPLMPLSVASGILTGLSTFFFGKYSSILAVSAGYFSINSIVLLCLFLYWRNRYYKIV